jgi:hypothetical protein
MRPDRRVSTGWRPRQAFHHRVRPPLGTAARSLLRENRLRANRNCDAIPLRALQPNGGAQRLFTAFLFHCRFVYRRTAMWSSAGTSRPAIKTCLPMRRPGCDFGTSSPCIPPTHFDEQLLRCQREQRHRARQCQGGPARTRCNCSPRWAATGGYIALPGIIPAKTPGRKIFLRSDRAWHIFRWAPPWLAGHGPKQWLQAWPR